MPIAILGGTGPEGLGIATRLAAAGEPVIVGSRSVERAEQAAKKLRARIPSARVFAAGNGEAAAQAELVFVSVPYKGLDFIIASCGSALDGKVVVDTIVPLRVVNGFFDLEPVPEGSAGERLQAKLPGARVVSGFKNESAADLADLSRAVDGDVVLCGNDEEAKRRVSDLVRRIPDLRPIDAGDLRNCRALECMTTLLLNVNRRYHARTSFRITGL